MSTVAEPRPLRVLFVTPKAVLGGAERWLLTVLDHSHRLEPHVVVLEDGPLVDALHDRSIGTEVVVTGAAGMDLARTSLAMRAVVRRVDPDVVVGNGIKASLVTLPCTVMAGVPFCWVRHDLRFSDSLGPAIGRLADATVFMAPPNPTETRRYTPVYLPPPVHTEPLDRSAARAALRDLGVPDDGRLLLGMFTRLVPQKGVDVAVQALAAAPSWRLVVAGAPDPAEPGEPARLRTAAERAGVADRVTWLAEVPQVGRLAAAFDTVAVLTRPGGKGYPDGESFPLSLIEAAAAGVPVIADPRRVPPLAGPELAAGTIEVDSENPDDVARALAILSDGARRRAHASAMAAAGAAHPRPQDTADAFQTLLAALAFRPDAGNATGPPISVVSTVKNEGIHAEVLVRTLLGQAADDDRVVIVDGGSQDDTVTRLQQVAESDPRLRVVSAPGCGISEGRNLGVAAADTDWIACTDAGCAPDPVWLAALRGAADGGTADLITGTYRAAFGTGSAWEIALAHVAYPQPAELRRRTPLVRAYGSAFGRAYDATLPTGRSVAFTRRAWLAAAGFPEDLPTAEDVMFGQNAVRAGARAVLCADACVTWDQRPSLRSNARMFYGYGHGDGLSADRRLIGRDLLRAAVYAAAPPLLLGRRTRTLTLIGAAGYLSLPLVRAVRGPRPLAAAFMVPPMAALRDVSKAAGCLVGIRDRWRDR